MAKHIRCTTKKSQGVQEVFKVIRLNKKHMVHNNRDEQHITKENMGKNRHQNKSPTKLPPTGKHPEPLSAREPQKQAHPSKATRIGQGYIICKK